MPPPPALVLRFPLEALRRAHGHRVPPGADPRHDTAPFRAFRDALLGAAAGAATGEAALSMWWEGTFNGYALCVQAAPAAAVPGLEGRAGAACGVDPEEARLAPPREDGYPLARVRPGGSELARAPDGARLEAPFGAAGGHFGAPGMRRFR